MFAAGRCPVCDGYHSSGRPHNLASPKYRYQFFAENGRFPTLADAAEHCSLRMQEALGIYNNIRKKERA